MNEERGIGWAVKQMQNGDRVRRAGWNGKGMWLALERPNAALGALRITLPFVLVSTAQGDIMPGTCSQADLLAIDWELA